MGLLRLGFSPCYRPSICGSHNPRSEPGCGWSGQAARNSCSNSLAMLHMGCTEALVRRYLEARSHGEFVRVRIDVFWIKRQCANTPSLVHFHSGDISGVLYLKTPRLMRLLERSVKITFQAGRPDISTFTSAANRPIRSHWRASSLKSAISASFQSGCFMVLSLFWLRARVSGWPSTPSWINALTEQVVIFKLACSAINL